VRRLAVLPLILLLVPAISRAEEGKPPPLQTVPSVDLARYAGKWYEIARLPAWFQKKCAGEVVATYTLLEKSEMKVVNECRDGKGEIRKSEGKARPAASDGPASKLKVRFAPSWMSWLPMVWGDYWIIELDEDYRYSVVGTPDRKYLWILSRTPQMDEATYAGIVERAAGAGFEVARLVMTEQAPGN